MQRETREKLDVVETPTRYVVTHSNWVATRVGIGAQRNALSIDHIPAKGRYAQIWLRAFRSNELREYNHYICVQCDPSEDTKCEEPSYQVVLTPLLYAESAEVDQGVDKQTWRGADRQVH